MESTQSNYHFENTVFPLEKQERYLAMNWQSLFPTRTILSMKSDLLQLEGQASASCYWLPIRIAANESGLSAPVS